MRVAILILVLAISYAQQTGGRQTTGGQQTGGQTNFNNTPPSDQQQVGGCKNRCRKLTFIGEGSVPVKPNWALVDLSVEVSSSQLQGGSQANMNASGTGGQSEELQAAKKVRDEAQHRSMFILNYLKDLNSQDLRDLETQEISFKPEWDDDDNSGERKFMGYKGTFGLRFKVKIDKFQDVLDHIVSESGANRVDSIVFVPDDEVEQQASIKAIELASSNAWAQAQAIQKVMGIQGTLKLLSVRDRILPVKKLIRRFARRINDMDDDMDDMDSMLNWLQGDQIVNALLVFQFDFEDGTINFKEVAKNTTNLSVQDLYGDLLNKQNTTQPPQTNTQPPAVATPNTTAAILLPNNTAEMKPVETQPGGQPVQPITTQPPQ